MSSGTPSGMRLRTKSCFLIWALLTMQHGRCDDIPQAAQKAVSLPDTQEEPESTRGVRSVPPYGIGGPGRLLPHYGYGLPGLHHGFGDLVTAHHGLGGHRGLELIHGHGLGDTYGSGFHGGLLGSHHTISPLHRMRKASDDNELNPPNRLTFYGHPERNQISNIAPALEAFPVRQKYGMPLDQTNGNYEPQLRYNIAGIDTSSHPATKLWHYPGVGAHGIGVGLGANYRPGTPEQYSKGLPEHHAGWISALHDLHNVHGMAGLGKPGLPQRVIPGHNGEVTGVPVMEIHKNIPHIHGSSSSGYGGTIGGYQEIANDHNFGIHKDMHIGETDSYHGASQYHGMAGYHKHLGDNYQTNGHHGINGYHGSGWYTGGVADDHGPLTFGESSQGPLPHGHGNQWDEDFETDQNNKFSIFKKNIHLKRDKHNKMHNKRDSSEWRNLLPSTDEKFSGSESLETKTSETNYKMEENNESTSLPEGMGNDSKENANNAKHFDTINSDNTVGSSKTSDTVEVSRHDTTSPDNLGGRTKLSMSNNFLYNTGMSVADYPSVLSNGERSATLYARGLLIDLLNGGRATLDAGNSNQIPDAVSLTGADNALGGAQNGITAKHTPGGTYLTESGNSNRGGSKIQQYEQSPQELGYIFNDNADGKLWTRYNSRQYDYHGGDFDYGLVPITYWPWYNSYGQYYMTPYPTVQTDYGYGLMQF
ncbi:hypothetical protein B7P43_G09378 [Cryptotermes secundus]|uniref:Uncharacterized protein n=1 Tax=Cryptotermes secundus TaxID=105785 RepID=A0A2J7QJ49_9NEOP|nr:uncharacterized protein LOC111867208 [Cryptotermes secundus]PNF28614.1 hypothetical protein B7P43_G09378 [Cryptotermes secundus]